MAAYRDRRPHGRVVPAALAIYALTAAGLVALLLWRLWAEVLGGVLP